MRGRRPKSGAPAREMQVNPQDPEVQAAQDKAVKLVLATIEAEIQKRIKAGKGLDRMSLPDLLKELRELIKASKKSTPMLMMAMAPAQPQLAMDRGARAKEIADTADHPDKRDRLLESQERLLDRMENREALPWRENDHG